MDTMAGNVSAPVSIFSSDANTPELKMTMRDLASLGGVLKELGGEKMYDAPLEILRFINIIQLLNEAALGIKEPIEDEKMLYYRYVRTYNDLTPPDQKDIEHVIRLLQTNSWIAKQTRQIKLQDRGKRLMDALIRLANDTLAYYLKDDIGRSLFQARRDAEISEAYDDKGVSGGNRIASMIVNVEDAVQALENRQLELLAEKNALPQLQIIHELMMELEQKMKERLAQFQTIEESLIMTNLIQRGTVALAKGTTLSTSLLKKYVRFVTMQEIEIHQNVSPEKFRQYIFKMYNTETETNTPNVEDILSFMEQNLYTDEAMDGIWLPVKFTSPIGGADIDLAIDYLEHYEPKINEPFPETEPEQYEEQYVEGQTIEEIFKNAAWEVTKSKMDTEKIEQHLALHGDTQIEELILQTSSSSWSDAIKSLFVVSAMQANKKVAYTPAKNTTDYEKEWTWINDDDRKYTVSPRELRAKPPGRTE